MSLDEMIRDAMNKYNKSGDEADYRAWMSLNCRRIGHSIHQERDAFERYCMRCGVTQKVRFIYIRRVNNYIIIDTETLMWRYISVDGAYPTWIYATQHNDNVITIVPWEWHSIGELSLSYFLTDTLQRPEIQELIRRFHQSK